MHHNTCIRLKKTPCILTAKLEFLLSKSSWLDRFFFFVRFKEVHVGQVPHTRGEIRWVNPYMNQAKEILSPKKQRKYCLIVMLVAVSLVGLIIFLKGIMVKCDLLNVYSLPRTLT